MELNASINDVTKVGGIPHFARSHHMKALLKLRTEKKLGCILMRERRAEWSTGERV